MERRERHGGAAVQKTVVGDVREERFVEGWKRVGDVVRRRALTPSPGKAPVRGPFGDVVGELERLAAHEDGVSPQRIKSAAPGLSDRRVCDLPNGLPKDRFGTTTAAERDRKPAISSG